MTKQEFEMAMRAKEKMDAIMDKHLGPYLALGTLAMEIFCAGAGAMGEVAQSLTPDEKRLLSALVRSGALDVQ